MTRAYVGLGSNLGDREQTIRRAIQLLAAEDGVEVVAVSSLRETAPMYEPDQPPFVNGVAVVETSFRAAELLERLLKIERALGRTRVGSRYGPRTIDLDLLLFGNEIVAGSELTLPHPRLHERRFALEPLSELDAGLVVPGRGPVSALLAALD